MAHDVFISYSSKDKAIADAICAHLEGNGVRCWLAPRDIAPGEDWPTAITKAISLSRIMVLVFSANANSSEHVSRELMLAVNNKLVIIPFKIENIEPEPGKQYYLARTHWLDAINPPTVEQINTLVDVVKKMIRTTPPILSSNQPVQPRSKNLPDSKKPAWIRLLWISGIVIFLLISVYLLVFVTYILPLPNTPPATINPTQKMISTPDGRSGLISPSSTATSNQLILPTSLAKGILFQDDFSLNANNWETGHVSKEEGEVDFQIVDGKYRWTLTSKPGDENYLMVFPNIPNLIAKDFVLSIDATIVDISALPGNLYIQFTVREENWGNGMRYEFGFFNNNRYSVVVWPSSDPTSTKKISSGVMKSAKIEKGITNTFVIKAKDTNFTFSINGNEIGSFTDTTINEAGSISITVGVTKPGESVIVEFDNLTVQGIP